MRAARVAKGGPERLDKPDVEMKGDKGKGKGGKGKGKFQLTKNMWRGWNPGKGAQLPLTGPQWMNWMPPQGPQANTFQQQMFSPGYQLNSLTPKKILSAAHVRETAVLYQPGLPSPGVARAAVTTGDQQKLSVFSEKRLMSSLKPLSTSSEWEYIETILDSGATVTVIPPHVGRSYEVVPSAASRAGVKYEVANGDEIPNLREKLMPVMTREGSMRGLRAQVADVSKALQSVRALVKAGHVVIFGDGEQGECHYVYNKFTGETNEVTDDGINYLMGMYIIPPDDAGFGRPAN